MENNSKLNSEQNQKENKEKEEILRVANEDIDLDKYKNNGEYDKEKLRSKIEPWLTAVFQSEHLSLLCGSGLTIALTGDGGFPSIQFSILHEKIEETAKNEAKEIGRGKPNFEDYLRVAIELYKGLKIHWKRKPKKFLKEINNNFLQILKCVLNAESKFLESENKKQILLKRFLLSFASRTASRERLNIFTTNYDRIIEYGLDEAGILILDRFIGKLKPKMRFHRIDLDYHYNPPGIRGEPRYVEGVVRYTKLHGSIDWKFEGKDIVKSYVGFGDKNHTFSDPFDKVIIFPNSSKAIETTFFPYSELFRDFATAICRSNSVLVTYGYGFGDSHINQIIQDMLTIPSTHLVIISYDTASGRINNFIENCNKAQLTLLIGKHFGDLATLVENYLPKPAIDYITDREAKILEKRQKIDNKRDNNLNEGKILV